MKLMRFWGTLIISVVLMITCYAVAEEPELQLESKEDPFSKCTSFEECELICEIDSTLRKRIIVGHQHVECVKNNNFHGLHMSWFLNGAIWEKNEFVDGFQHGQSLTMYDNGEKEREGTYQKGQKQGFWSFWHSNGALKSQGNFEGDAMCGAWKCWDEDENPKSCLVNKSSTCQPTDSGAKCGECN